MCCNRDMKCKYTIVLCIIFYVFLCLFGNIITGIFIYRNRLTEEDDESVAETILSSFESSVDYNVDLENNTFDLDDFIAKLEEETTEIYDLIGSISTDSENSVIDNIFLKDFLLWLNKNYQKINFFAVE